MPQKISVIKCRKCGHESNIISDTCIKCGAKLEKVCGGCGFANAVEKNYCDQCGMVMVLKAPPKQDDTGAPPPPPPPTAAGGEKPPEKPKYRLEMQPIQDTISEKDISFRKLFPGKPAAPGVPGAEALNKPVPPAAGGGQSRKAISISVKMPSVKKIAGILITAGLFCALVFLLYLIAAPHIPKFKLEMTAKSYLKKLSTGRYEEAYDLLSSNSKAAVSMADYVNYSRQYYAKAPPWEVQNVKMFVMAPEAAMVKYQLKEGSAPWRADYISFVKEHDRWTRPYIWMLFEPIESAIAKQDYPQAMFLAQKLYLTDPMDPRSSGYLCVSEFFMGLYDKSADSCKKTIASVMTYPSSFSAGDMFWFKIYYADSLRFVQKYEEALEKYDELLKIPTLLAKDQCPLYLNRADALVRMKKYDSALYDMLKADAVCPDANKAEVLKKTRFLNGAAMQEAVDLAQKARFKPDLPPLAELRKKDYADLAAMLGPRNMKFMPKDNWITAHLSGPEYRVILRQEGINPRTRQKDFKDLYVFMVNLWTGVIKLERDPSQPAQTAVGSR
ncbi:MAG: hypothetical protein KKH28_13090 [Elusimicrobia bacterium]|nr:hypothetical protein [Elusimicrobiota bacterium]